MSLITGSFLYKNLESEQDERLAYETAQKLINLIEEYEMSYSEARPEIIKAFSKQREKDPIFVKMIFDELDSHYN